MIKEIASFFILAWIFATPALGAILPNDQFFYNQWYLSRIKAESAWESISSSPDIVVAVIDAGVDIEHPDLQQSLWTNAGETAGNGKDDDHNGFIDDYYGWDFVSNVPDPSPVFEEGWDESAISHGTMVAGIIAATGNNRIGVAGVTWKAKIMSLKVMDSNGEGRVGSVIRAIDYATNNGANIINLSFVGFNYSDALHEAIGRAYEAGVIVVAAAGNEQSSGLGYDTDKVPLYPACYDGKDGENMVIGVAATDALDQKASFSSYGFNCVDISAPGISFFNTITSGGNPIDPSQLYDGYWSGTSMAVPVVSGALALVLQANPEVTPEEAANIVLGSTDNISLLNPSYLGQLGTGRLNLERAIDLAQEYLDRYSRSVIAVPGSGLASSSLVVMDASGKVIRSWEVPAEYANGASIQAGDVDGDYQDEYILAARAGSAPLISVYELDGTLVSHFFAYSQNFKGGVSLALGDLDGDGQKEIITGALAGGGPQVRIFNLDGRPLQQFFAASESFRGGVSVSSGNIDGKGNDEIVVGLGQGTAPEIKIYSNDLKLVGRFLAYEKSFQGGIHVTVANIDGRADRGRYEIIASPMGGRDPELRIFDDHGRLKESFYAFSNSWQKGFTTSVGDVDNDGEAEIMAAASAGGTPHIRSFDSEGNLRQSFFAYAQSFSGGLSTSVIRIRK